MRHRALSLLPMGQHVRRAAVILVGTLGSALVSGSQATAGTGVGTGVTVAQATPAGLPLGVLGPFGVITVLIGLAGMLVGLARAAVLRRSRRTVHAGRLEERVARAHSREVRAAPVSGRADAREHAYAVESPTQPLARVEDSRAA